MTSASTPAFPTPQGGAAPALGPERAVAWPRRTVRTLSNGMQVVLAETRTIPKISAQLFVRSGNAAVGQRAPGLAEMTAALCADAVRPEAERLLAEALKTSRPSSAIRSSITGLGFSKRWSRHSTGSTAQMPLPITRPRTNEL